MDTEILEKVYLEVFEFQCRFHALMGDASNEAKMEFVHLVDNIVAAKGETALRDLPLLWPQSATLSQTTSFLMDHDCDLLAGIAMQASRYTRFI